MNRTTCLIERHATWQKRSHLPPGKTMAELSGASKWDQKFNYGNAHTRLYAVKPVLTDHH